MILLELFYSFFLIGLFTFGGGQAMIPLIESEVVSKGWIDESTFINMIAISESTPGPIAINVATFAGYKVYGVLGSIISTLAVVLPSFIVILIVAIIMNKLIENKYVEKALNGIKPVIVGLIFYTALSFLYKISISSIDPFKLDFLSIIAFILTIILSFIFKKIKKKSLSPYMIIIISGSIGIIYYLITLL